MHNPMELIRCLRAEFCILNDDDQDILELIDDLDVAVDDGLRYDLGYDWDRALDTVKVLKEIVHSRPGCDKLLDAIGCYAASRSIWARCRQD